MQNHAVEVDGALVSRRHPLRLAAVVATAVLVALATAAAGLWLWLRTYAPLDARGSFAPGAHLAADVEPTTGSGGRTVFLPAYRRGRPFDTAFTLRNTGRFAVEVKGLAPAGRPREVQPVALLATDSPTASADSSHLHPFAALRLARGDSVILVVRWRLDCSHTTRTAYRTSLPLRYGYLSLFTRTERVELPFAVTLRCSG